MRFIQELSHNNKATWERDERLYMASIETTGFGMHLFLKIWGRDSTLHKPPAVHFEGRPYYLQAISIFDEMCTEENRRRGECTIEEDAEGLRMIKENPELYFTVETL